MLKYAIFSIYALRMTLVWGIFKKYDPDYDLKLIKIMVIFDQNWSFWSDLISRSAEIIEMINFDQKWWVSHFLKKSENLGPTTFIEMWKKVELVEFWEKSAKMHFLNFEKNFKILRGCTSNMEYISYKLIYMEYHMYL